MDSIDFEHIYVEDRLLSCLRAEQSGEKLRRVINLKRQNLPETVYRRWASKEATQKLRDNIKEIQEKTKTPETKQKNRRRKDQTRRI
jgi:hypothetical protein